jgi:hypothetical protein
VPVPGLSRVCPQPVPRLSRDRPRSESGESQAPKPQGIERGGATTSDQQQYPNTRLIVWDNLHFRLQGARIAEIVGREIEKMKAPISMLTLQFSEGLLKIDGKIRQAIGIPFTVEIDRIEPLGTTLQIFLRRASAFGLPLPTFLLGLIRERLAAQEVEYDHPSRSFRVRLDRFLPPFADVQLIDVQLIAGGIAVRLGPGGADPPQQNS